MSDILPIRLAKLCVQEFYSSAVEWDELSETDQDDWQRAAMAAYQQGVADALKDPGSA